MEDSKPGTETTETDHVKITYQKEVLDMELPKDITIHELAQEFADTIQADVERVSLFITPRPGLLKYPFPSQLLFNVITPKTRIKAIGTPSMDVQKLNDMAARIAAKRTAREQVRQTRRGVKHTVNRDWKKIQEEATYTFHAIEPLNYLPVPEKSRRYLERLANDPGIKASMRKHKFSVGLLTEMNPAEHTTHESKTLGLNRNGGEVIELRLRTDAYDGYRDYKIIRKTLCHELAHNVHSDHDRNFWDLTKQIEKEVDQNDFLSGGYKLSEGEFFNPEDEFDGDYIDDHGWQGGEFVLGGTDGIHGLDRREIMARAAISRIKAQKQAEEQQKEADSGAGTSG